LAGKISLGAATGCGGFDQGGNSVGREGVQVGDVQVAAGPVTGDILPYDEGVGVDEVEDNGTGLGPVNLSSKGSGHGLALHSTMMAIVGGTLAMESSPGRYTRITLSLPEGSRAESLGAGGMKRQREAGTS